MVQAGLSCTLVDEGLAARARIEWRTQTVTLISIRTWRAAILTRVDRARIEYLTVAAREAARTLAHTLVAGGYS